MSDAHVVGSQSAVCLQSRDKQQGFIVISIGVRGCRMSDSDFSFNQTSDLHQHSNQDILGILRSDKSRLFHHITLILSETFGLNHGKKKKKK